MKALAGAVFVLLSGFLVGCPEEPGRSGSKPSVKACGRVGDRCELSPGKLGACVLRDGCDPQADPSGCYVCQSQH